MNLNLMNCKENGRVQNAHYLYGHFTSADKSDYLAIEVPTSYAENLLVCVTNRVIENQFK